MISRFNDQNWFPTLFNDFFDNDFWMTNRKNNLTAPAVNVLDEEKDYKVEVAAPGMTKDDFQIKIDNDNNLVITLEKKTETKDNGKKEDKKPASICAASSPTATISRHSLCLTISTSRRSQPRWSTVYLPSKSRRPSLRNLSIHLVRLRSNNG